MACPEPQRLEQTATYTVPDEALAEECHVLELSAAAAVRVVRVEVVVA